MTPQRTIVRVAILGITTFWIGLILGAVDSTPGPEQWPHSSDGERKLRDSALVISGLIDRDPNAAYSEFAKAIPANATAQTIQKLRDAITAQKWVNSRPDSGPVLRSLIEAYLRASAAHSAWDLINPRYGDAIAFAVFDLSGELKARDRVHICQTIVSAKIDLGNRKDLLWINAVARGMSGRESDFRSGDGIAAILSAKSDAARYFSFLFRSSIGDSMPAEDIDALFSKYVQSDDFVSFFFNYAVINDIKYSPLVKNFMRGQSAPGRAHSVVRETVLYKLLKHIPKQHADEEMLKLIASIQARSATLPALVTSAGVDESISRYFYVTLNQGAAISALERFAGK